MGHRKEQKQGEESEHEERQESPRETRGQRPWQGREALLSPCFPNSTECLFLGFGFLFVCFPHHFAFPSFPFAGKSGVKAWQ